MSGQSAEVRLDALVIGAGFAGLYALHRLRELGLRVRAIEAAENVGGTWLFNRYPGARCDIESIEYSYSFSDAIQQEWEWTETMPAQPEIEAYLNFVADRLDLRRDITFGTTVEAMTFDEDAAVWTLDTDTGRAVRGAVRRRGLRHPVGAAGARHRRHGFLRGHVVVHQPLAPGGVDLAGKRVGVIGTGSTGVQLIPVVARQAAELHVFQRSAAFTLPWSVRKFEPGELDALKADYPAIREAQRRAPGRRRPAQRLLTAARHARQAGDQIGIAGGAPARGRRGRRHGRAQLGGRLLRHRGQPDGHRTLRPGRREDRHRSGDGRVAGAHPSVRRASGRSSTRATTRPSTATT